MSDMRIFCLSILLSSALVYNSKAIIDEDAIEKLHFVGEMAELIKVKSKDNDEDEDVDEDVDEDEYSRYFPSFIWAVRDVTLQLEFGKPITEDEYLENALMLQKAENVQEKSSEKVNEHNKYKDCIRKYFKTRKCFMFELPSGDKKVLQNMEEVSEDQLNDEFMAQTEKFCDYIYEEAEVKYMDDIHKVTGEILANLATMYTEAINSSKAVCIEEVVTNISIAENTRAVEEATKHYEDKMEEKVKFPTETLDQILGISEECEKEALKIFMKKSFKDTDYQFHKQFLEIVEQKKSEIIKRNDMESRTRCQGVIKALSKDLEDSLEKGSYVRMGGYQMFKEEMERIEEKYNNEQGKGTKAEDVLQEFKKSKETIGLTIMMNDKSLSDQQKKIEEEKGINETQDLQRKRKGSQQTEGNKMVEHHRRIIEENCKEFYQKEISENKLQNMFDLFLSVILNPKTEPKNMVGCTTYEQNDGIFQLQIINNSNTQEKPGFLQSIIQKIMSFFKWIAKFFSCCTSPAD